MSIDSLRSFEPPFWGGIVGFPIVGLLVYGSFHRTLVWYEVNQCPDGATVREKRPGEAWAERVI